MAERENSENIELHVLIMLHQAGKGQVSYTHLLGPYRGQYGHTQFHVLDPDILINLYWVPKLPNAAAREKIMPGLEKYVNEILHGNGKLRQITHNRPIKLTAT